MRNIVCFVLIIVSLIVTIVLSNYISIIALLVTLCAALNLKTESHRSIKYKCGSCGKSITQVCKTPYGIVCQECMDNWIEEQVENNWE